MIFQWDMDPTHLPHPGQHFIINGLDAKYVFYWQPCDCELQCGRPVVFRVDTGREDILFTIIARGQDTGLDPAEEEIIVTQALINDYPELLQLAQDAYPEEFGSDPVQEVIDLPPVAPAPKKASPPVEPTPIIPFYAYNPPNPTHPAHNPFLRRKDYLH